jgi:hypothetical protein
MAAIGDSAAKANRKTAKTNGRRQKKGANLFLGLSGLAMVLAGVLLAIVSMGQAPPPVAPASQKSPFVGMSDDEYARCIHLGADTMHAIDSYGLDSKQYVTRYKAWYKHCSVEALRDVYQKNERAHFPTSPSDWAKTRQ